MNTSISTIVEMNKNNHPPKGIGLPEGKQTVKQMIRRMVNWCGYDITRKKDDGTAYPKDFSSAEIEIIKRVQPYTMTGPERIVGLISAVKYIVRNHIPVILWNAGFGEEGA